MNAQPATMNRSFTALRRFAKRREPVERCGVCSVDLAAEHQHLIKPADHQIVCACDACALLFDNPTSAMYRRVPRRTKFLASFRLSDAQWDSLLIPINMAFIFRSGGEGRVVAMYPSPAGAMESLLELASWGEIVAENPILETMQPEVEALLVNRLSRGPAKLTESQHYLAPIDECFKLVGLIRTHWQGLSGGTEVWQEVARFFETLRDKSQVA